MKARLISEFLTKTIKSLKPVIVISTIKKKISKKQIAKLTIAFSKLVSGRFEQQIASANFLL